MLCLISHIIIITNNSYLKLIFRKKRKPINHTYAIVSDLDRKTPNSAIEMVPESNTSSLALKLTIEDIHDHSENEDSAATKTPMKTVSYESGKRKLFAALSAYFFPISMNV